MDPLAAGAITPGARPPVRRRAQEAAHGPGSSPSTSPTSSASPTPPPARRCSASFVVILPGEHLATGAEPPASSTTACGAAATVSSSGPSRRRSGRPPAGSSGRPGDFSMLPAGCTTDPADPADPADRPTGRRRRPAYRVTDAPLLRLSRRPPRVAAGSSPPASTGAAARAPTGRGGTRPRASERSRVSVLLGNAATPQTLTVTHTLWAMLGVLPAGRVQRPHRHQSVALDLITDCAPGCYSLVGSPVDGRRRPSSTPSGSTGSPAGPSSRLRACGTAITTSPGACGLPGPHPGCRVAHLPPLARHPVRTRRRLTAVPFASALSEHPVAIASHRGGVRCGARGHR